MLNHKNICSLHSILLVLNDIPSREDRAEVLRCAVEIALPEPKTFRIRFQPREQLCKKNQAFAAVQAISDVFNCGLVTAIKILNQGEIEVGENLAEALRLVQELNYNFRDEVGVVAQESLCGLVG